MLAAVAVEALCTKMYLRDPLHFISKNHLVMPVMNWGKVGLAQMFSF